MRPALFRDRNFAAGVIFSAVAFTTLYALLALQPPYLQGLTIRSSPPVWSWDRVNRAFEDPSVAQFFSPVTAGRAALDALVTQQAQIVAYIDDYRLLLIATLALFLLLFIFSKTTGPADPTAAVEG